MQWNSATSAVWRSGKQRRHTMPPIVDELKENDMKSLAYIIILPN
jgi:hypothetical protein